MAALMIDFFYKLWHVSLEMAPFLIFGFVFAGFLSVLMPTRWVQRHLAGRGTFPVFKAALIGIPLPLCSCGVIPVSAGLRRQGASRSSVLSFLISTPQTGIDSILVTGGMLGWFFAFYRTFLALVSGFVAGILGTFLRLDVERDQAEAEMEPFPEGSDKCCCGENEEEEAGADKKTAPEPQLSCCRPEEPTADCCSTEALPPSSDGCERESEMTLPDENPGGLRAVIRKMLRFSFVQIPNDLAGSLIFGLVASALVAALVPDDYFQNRLGNLAEGGILGMLLMVVISVPLYVCATASVPLAAVLLQKGISAGMVLVFLMSGPATNAATISTVMTVLGRKAVVIYLVSIIGIAILAGKMLDMFYQTTNLAPGSLSVEIIPWSIKFPSALLLFGMILFGLWNRRGSSRNEPQEKKPCCK